YTTLFRSGPGAGARRPPVRPVGLVRALWGISFGVANCAGGTVERRRPRARTEEDDDTMTKVKGGRAARPAAQRPEQSAARPSLAQWAWEWVKSIAIAAVIFVVVRAFLVQTYTITSGSMENTALVGDFLIVSKAAYGTRVPLVGLRIDRKSTRLNSSH